MAAVSVDGTSDCVYCKSSSPKNHSGNGPKLKRGQTYTWQVYCNVCGARGPRAAEQEEAIDLWNAHYLRQQTIEELAAELESRRESSWRYFAGKTTDKLSLEQAFIDVVKEYREFRKSVVVSFQGGCRELCHAVSLLESESDIKNDVVAAGY